VTDDATDVTDASGVTRHLGHHILSSKIQVLFGLEYVAMWIESSLTTSHYILHCMLHLLVYYTNHASPG
jgi:hypothetical protein